MPAWDNQDEAAWYKLCDWWRRYGRLCLFAGLGICLSFLSYALITSWKAQDAGRAMRLYHRLLHENRLQEPVYYTLVRDHPKSVYAVLADLHRAKWAIDNQQYTDAVQLFSQAAARTRDPFLRYVAITRQARVLLQQREWDAAIALLQPEMPASMTTKSSATTDLVDKAHPYAKEYAALLSYAFSGKQDTHAAETVLADAANLPSDYPAAIVQWRRMQQQAWGW